METYHIELNRKFQRSYSSLTPGTIGKEAITHQLFNQPNSKNRNLIRERNVVTPSKESP